MRNPPTSHKATITERGGGRTVVALTAAEWHALSLQRGDRVIVETYEGDAARGIVTGDAEVTLSLSLGAVGDSVRVRRPRGETFATREQVAP